MRNVVVYELLSLDGVAEDPSTFFFEFDDVMRENLRRVIGTQDDVLLGRRTYDEWARFWPSSEIEPFATFINGVRKHVASSTPLAPAWNGAERLEGDVATFVAELRQGSGGDIGVHGSISVARTLLEAGLVDRLCLVVAPVVHGGGRRLFDGAGPARFSLTRSAASPSGHLMLELEPRR